MATASTTSADDIKYAGFTRFELELEFVQCLGNPWYMNYLATQKLYDEPAFVAYLDYLQYFARPEYAKFLTYPMPTLRALRLLQQERFRNDVLMPETIAKLMEVDAQAVPGER